jgi:sigma-B regulation protein RsbU (phosphoserine phosphatase)
MIVRNGAVQEIHAEGVPLGLFPDVAYDEIQIELQTGDIVVFASDGILESVNTEQEEFGPQRLRSLLERFSSAEPAQGISEQILSATDAHAGFNVAPHDDRTLIVLRVEDHETSDFSKLPIIY